MIHAAQRLVAALASLAIVFAMTAGAAIAADYSGLGASSVSKEVVDRFHPKPLNAAKKRGVEAELILFADEGHGAQKRENRVSMIGHPLEFFERHLKAGR